MEKDFKLWSHVTIGNYLRKRYPSTYYALNVYAPEDDEGNGKEFPGEKPPYHTSREQSMLDILREIYQEVPTIGAVAKRRIKDICGELISLIEESNEAGDSKDHSLPYELFSLEESEPDDNPDF